MGQKFLHSPHELTQDVVAQVQEKNKRGNWIMPDLWPGSQHIYWKVGEIQVETSSD